MKWKNRRLAVVYDWQWREHFEVMLLNPSVSLPFKYASEQGNLTDWTGQLTRTVVKTCQELGWEAAAKGHRLHSLPEFRSEYLSLDVTAFTSGDQKWRFPIAVLELENSQSDDRIAYSLWKVLCVRAGLRVVFCYRKEPYEAGPLVRKLADEVVKAMGLEALIALGGETIVVVGSRGESDTFPYGFFKWWRLEKETGTFRSM